MHIAISGNIGTGKTTLAGKLARHYGWQVEYESVDQNPYLVDFYSDMKRWAFHLQIYFLNSRFNQIHRINKSEETIIQDRTIYEDAHIFAANLHNSGFIARRDYDSYLEIYRSMIQFVTPPELLIYLRADIPKLVKNIERRGREYEEKISIEYLKNIGKYYEDWITSYDLGRLLIINVNELDFVENVEDFAHIVERVDTEMHGLFSV